MTTKAFFHITSGISPVSIPSFSPEWFPSKKDDDIDYIYEWNYYKHTWIEKRNEHSIPAEF